MLAMLEQGDIRRGLLKRPSSSRDRSGFDISVFLLDYNTLHSLCNQRNGNDYFPRRYFF